MSHPIATPVRVLVADEQRLSAEGLCRLLPESFDAVGIAADGREMVRIAAAESPELVVADLAIFTADGFAVARNLRSESEARVLVLGMEHDPAAVKAILSAGAHGYLLKSAEPEELLFALDRVSRGHPYLSPELTESLLDPAPWPAPDDEPGNGDGRPRIRVLVADDLQTSRLAVRAYLLEYGDIEVVGEASDGREAIARAAELRPDVVLMDLRMPVLDGVGATKALLAGSGGPQVVVLTAIDDTREMMEAVRAGALGYLTKDAGAGDVARAIRRAHRGEPSLPPAIARALLDREAPPPPAPVRPTERELEIVRLAARGFSNRRIADRLCVSEATVRSHLRNVSEKLGGCNRVELVLHALRVGWASLDAAG